jgi:hypothetical protein
MSAGGAIAPDRVDSNEGSGSSRIPPIADPNAMMASTASRMMEVLQLSK